MNYDKDSHNRQTDMTQRKKFPPDMTFVAEVIITTKERRGTGDGKDPIRIITQVYTKGGELIAEYDPNACEHCGKFNCPSDHK